MSALSLEDFRSAFPAFTEDEYPDIAVNTRLILADRFFSEEVWTDEFVRSHAMGLYAAHFLAAYGSPASGGVGYGSGSGAGIVSSKAVDGASVSFDTGSSLEANAGFWNSTPYGRELWQLMRVFGGGAVQL